jgi:hypothetical protein
MKALSVLVLRFKRPEARAWKVPFNITVGGKEWPVGLAFITATLFILAIINVLTKELATIAGVSFTLAFFIVFYFSERYHAKREVADNAHLEKFRLDENEEVSRDRLAVRPGNILVAVRNPSQLEHLEKVLAKTDTRKIDIVALSVHIVTQAASGEHDLEADQIFSHAEIEVFTNAVTLAEKAGKHIELLAVAGATPWVAMVQTAQKLQSSRIVTGLSPKLTPSEQGQVSGAAWEQLEPPRPSLSLEVVLPESNQSVYYNLGPHPPRLWPEDVDLVHRLWLELSEKGPGAKLRHRDIVGVALRRLEQEIRLGNEPAVLEELHKEVLEHPSERVPTKPLDE